MKKIHIYLLFLVSFMIGITSCGDNTDFSNLHTLTAAEQAELDRQDSIKKANQGKIDADLTLYYTFEMTTSTSAYEAGKIAIDMDKIAEKFGISTENLLKGIAGESGAPEVKGFAIQGSTGADYGSASTTNGKWGHWFNVSADAILYGDGSQTYVYAEFSTETGMFTLGQHPGRLKDGDTIRIVEGLKYNEIRVAVAITIKAKAPGQVTATIVNTQKLSIAMSPRSAYDTDPVQFDVTRTLSDLGISSLDDAKMIAVNADGSYAQESNAGNKGYWYDMDGFAGQWGDESSVYTSLDSDDDGNYYIGIGQYPDHCKLGDKFVIKYGFLANNKIEMLEITVNIVGYQDPETPPTGDPEDVEKDIEMTKAWDDDYLNVQVDVKDILRNAFKMTTYQIYSAILSGDLKIYLNEVSEDAPSYTADEPGYWIKADGTVGAWGESIIWCSLGHSETKLYLYGGNHHENAVAGDVLKTKFIVVCNGAKATFNLTYTLTEAAE
ncbi:MAG: DUF4859 domain-containing protein [Tannerella sp.]|jgi:hypothetical protein|nr:DUF4859 domain-containing protein [Tannerella sp.]